MARTRTLRVLPEEIEVGDILRVEDRDLGYSAHGLFVLQEIAEDRKSLICTPLIARIGGGYIRTKPMWVKQAFRCFWQADEPTTTTP